MPSATSTVDKILAAAQARMREDGYHGVSFRDIAADVGIKSASVHHHFPTKADLAVAVVKAYDNAHREILGDPNDEKRKPGAAIKAYVEAFRSDIADRGRMCLCGVLASEASTLPKPVQAQVRKFFDQDLAWLEAVLARMHPGARRSSVKAKALLAAAAMEGALMVSHCRGDAQDFEAVAKVLSGLLSD